MARFGDFDQYLDNAGDPLAEGKLYFYESGTTTPKTTYADINNSIPNTNPVLLSAAGRQPNIFFDGVAKVILTDNDDVQIAVRDPAGETGTDFGDEWVATKIYNAVDVVLGSDGIYYRSLINGNQNNNPVTTTGSWTLLYSVEWNAGITYSTGDVVSYGSQQYQSLQDTNLNQNPSSATSYWVSLAFAWLSTATYSEDQNVVGTDGILYTSLQNSNTGNDPASSPAYWVGTSAAAAASAIAAAASASAALDSENAADADAIATAADRVQTGLDAAATSADAIATAADRVQTGLDAAATAADRVQTGLDATATAADRVQTGLDAAATSADAIATAADRVQTGLDVIATNADAIATSADAIATAADRVQTGLDVVATAADRVQTGLDATAASGSASAASDSAIAAAASATDASDKYDEFDDRYLGEKASDPTLDNDGNALVTGALYFNTSTDAMKVYTGSVWVDVAPVATSITVSQISDYTGTATELNYTDGVTSPIQTQLDAKAVYPNQTGNAGSFLTTDGTDVSWAALPEIKTPTNISPANASTDIGETPTLTGSTYFSLYGKTQKSSQWQISTDPTFAATDYDSGEVLGVGVTHAVPAGNLVTSETYYWRARYRDIDDVFSEYSTPTEFATATSFNNFIATPTATPAIGASFEGGFFTGLIWNQVTQSATSTAIGTGSKTFTVTDAAPLFYSGQAVEIRSRANPSTARMIGTVTGSGGTTLVVNVTSVDGSGTLSDWSVMAKFRIIVAPKSSGENTSKAYKNTNDGTIAAAGTLTEGLKATLALVADGNSTVYPAAHFCNDLSIGSYTDWYLPARDELELIYRNLKPVTDNNYTTANRPTGATPDYKNLGSLGDVANTHGLNNNSDPQGVAYTTTAPAQTSVAAFKSGGAEAMTFGSNYYWSSTEYSTTFAWGQGYSSSFAGNQDNFGKNSTYAVRAVRRSII